MIGSTRTGHYTSVIEKTKCSRLLFSSLKFPTNISLHLIDLPKFNFHLSLGLFSRKVMFSVDFYFLVDIT